MDSTLTRPRRRRRDASKSTLIARTHDYIHNYHGFWRSGGICRIKIFQEELRPPVIVCTELPANNNSSISIMAECLAAEVVLEHFPTVFEAIGEPFVWIEHHPAVPQLGIPAVFLWVTFASYAPRQVLRFGGMPRVALGQAHWTHIERADIEELLALEPETTTFDTAA